MPTRSSHHRINICHYYQRLKEVVTPLYAITLLVNMFRIIIAKYFIMLYHQSFDLLHRCRERDFLKKLLECVEKGGKVLIPVFALGRAQELCILLETLWYVCLSVCWMSTLYVFIIYLCLSVCLSLCLFVLYI